MSDVGKITEAHRRRRAVAYVRQSTAAQLERNHESRARQYALRDRAIELGWPAASVSVVDEDLGRSGASTDGRLGFKDLVAEVGLGHVGLVLALEVSRFARSASRSSHTPPKSPSLPPVSSSGPPGIASLTTRTAVPASVDRTAGRTSGHPWGEPVATSGEIQWPPTGRFSWPPTVTSTASSTAAAAATVAWCWSPSARITA